MLKTQAVVIFPEANYELSLGMENGKRESWRQYTSSPKIGILVLYALPLDSLSLAKFFKIKQRTVVCVALGPHCLQKYCPLPMAFSSPFLFLLPPEFPNFEFLRF
jgi:hypothetical protein